MGGLEPGNTVAGLALVGLQIFGGVEGQDTLQVRENGV